MSLRESLGRVLNEYGPATKSDFQSHELADFLRNSIPEILKGKVNDRERYIFVGSAGQGNWASIPWIAILDVLVTDSAQKGYYPVYLFREDLSGLYLSLNQGVTAARLKFKTTAPQALRTLANDYRAQLGGAPNEFPLEMIDLRPSGRSALSSDYESGNVCAKLYERENLPTEEQLVSDLWKVLEIYETLRSRESLPIGSEAEEDDEYKNPNLLVEEDYRKFRLHKRIERSHQISKKVKEIQGYTCNACGFDFSKIYPGIPENRYIEAHHLTPISELKGQKVSLDPSKDFAVLCANCHRMIHRFDRMDDVEAFRKANNL